VTLVIAIASYQNPCIALIQLGEPGGQQLDESRFSEIRVIAQEFLDGLDVFWHFSVASAIAGWPSGK
jgi:hypothetical protein